MYAILKLSLKSLEKSDPICTPACVCTCEIKHGGHSLPWQPAVMFLNRKQRQLYLSSWTLLPQTKKNIWVPKPHEEALKFWAVTKVGAPAQAQITRKRKQKKKLELPPPSLSHILFYLTYLYLSLDSRLYAGFLSFFPHATCTTWAHKSRCLAQELWRSSNDLACNKYGHSKWCTCSHAHGHSKWRTGAHQEMQCCKSCDADHCPQACSKGKTLDT